MNSPLSAPPGQPTHSKLAIENYEKSLALNPKSETGKEALAKLRGAKTP